MKKTLGRLAGAVLAGAVISLAVTPVAMAQTETTTTPPAPSSEASSSTPAAPSYSGGKVTTETSAPASSSSQEPTPTSTSEKPTSGKPSPTSTSEAPTSTTPPMPELNVGAGYVEGNEGALAILCGSEPADVTAPDFTIVDSFQDGGEAYLWIYIIEAKPGFKGTASTFTWTCDGKPGKGDIEFEGTVGGGATAPGNDKPKKQVKLKPKGGIETGFGATAA
ncbi:hypothetical protein LCL61_06675 [Amycolatopsis coloradensis]|uniref:Uncharacterized protein n=1 Tax=Amycolatopsis coloradensis TaxID=76021 RepID=A0ACD5B7B2_9PSEU